MSEPAVDAADYVLVRVGTARYAVAMGDVGEIGRTPEVTRVPGVAPFVAGMANWRGSALAVLDCHELLAAGGTGAPGAHLAVLRCGEVELGLLVDAVEGVLTQAAAPTPVPASVPAPVAALLAGTVLDADGCPVAVLDAAALVALRRQL